MQRTRSLRSSAQLLAVAVVTAVATWPASACAQATPPWDAFATQFRDYVQADGVVGASVLIMRDGVVTSRIDVGDQHRAAKIPVSSETIYHWGSITKALTAISIMQLRDRGKLTLDDPILRYVPELRKLHDPLGAMEKVTLRMLLSHSAGFRNGTWPYGAGKPWEPFEPTTWEQLVAMMPYQELLFPPGTRYGYSNPAFVYLARVIEQITGDPWDSYVQKNIFAPLGMQRSYFRNTPYFLAASRSHNYTVRRDSATGASTTVDNGADFDPGITTPNGGWNAPLGDLVQYVAFLTNATQSNGAHTRYDAVLSRASLREMWTPVVPMTQGYESAPDHSMGLSFFLLGTDDRRLIGHTGSQAGFRSFFYFNPKTTAAVIAVFNTTAEVSPASAAYRRVHEAAQALIR